MPSYYWMGPGYGMYEDGLSGFIAADRYIDITVFGNNPGHLQAALNAYNNMVSAAFSNATADEINRSLVQQYLTDNDPSNDGQAAQILAQHPNVGIQLADGRILYGQAAASYLATINPSINPSLPGYINVGTIATVTITPSGSTVTSTFNPFAIYDDGYGGTCPVIWHPQQQQYVPWDPSNQGDREIAAMNYAQQAEAYRAAGDLDKAFFCEQMARFFQVSPQERVGYAPGFLIDRNYGTAMSGLTPDEIALATVRLERTVAVMMWQGANLNMESDPNATSNSVYQAYMQMLTLSQSGNPTSARLRSIETLNAQGVQNGAGIAGAIDLYNTTVRWMAANQFMNFLADSYGREDQLLRRIVADSTYLVPPRPNEVNTYLNNLVGSGIDPVLYNQMLNQLAELSAAFWGTGP